MSVYPGLTTLTPPHAVVFEAYIPSDTRAFLDVTLSNMSFEQCRESSRVEPSEKVQHIGTLNGVKFVFNNTLECGKTVVEDGPPPTTAPFLPLP